MRKLFSVALFFIAVLFFVLPSLRVGFANPDLYQLTINPAAGGTTIPPPRNYSYSYGTNVTVTAIPDPGYIFAYWTDGSGNFMGSANPITLIMTWNVTLQSVYENIASAKRTLTILAGNNGTTDPPPGDYTYAYGENVTITAIPDPGYFLEYWTDGFGHNFGEGQDQLMLTMTWNFTDQPVFENAATAERTLTINATVGGTTSPPPGNYTYGYNASVTVTADSRFGLHL